MKTFFVEIFPDYIYSLFVFSVFMISIAIQAGSSDTYFSNIYALDSHTIVLETAENVKLANSNWATEAYENVNNYNILRGAAGETVSITTVSIQSNTNLILCLEQELVYGEKINLSYENLAFISAGNEVAGRRGSLNTPIFFLRPRSVQTGIPLAWGVNTDGRCDTNGLEEIVAVAAGDDFTIYLKKNGTVVNKGTDDYNSVTNWSDIVSIEGKGKLAAGLKSDGTLELAGDSNVLANLAEVEGWTNIIEVAVYCVDASKARVVGLHADGSVLSTDGAVVVTNRIISVKCGEDYNTVGTLDVDGKLTWVDKTEVLENVKFFDQGDFYSIAAKNDGTLEYNGNANESWNLDDFTGINQSLVKAISCGRFHTLYLMEDGEVIIKGVSEQSWTELPNALLGDHAPAIVVAAGRQHSVVLLGDGNSVPSESNVEVSIKEGMLWEYQVEAQEISSAGGLSYQLLSGKENLPEGCFFNEAGLFYWLTKEENGPGSYNFQVRVSQLNDFSIYEDVTIVLSVEEVNQAPVLYVPDDSLLSVEAGSTLDLFLRAEDMDIPAQNLTFSLLDSPEGMILGPEDGLIQWTPEEEHRGTNSVTVQVSDGLTQVSKTFDIIVTVPVPPLMCSPIADIEINEEIEWSLELNLSGGSGNYSCELIEAPEGMILRGEYFLEWTPSEEQGQGGGTIYSVSVRVNDLDTGEMLINSFSIKVLEVNFAPCIGDIPNQDVLIGEVFNLNVGEYVTDADIPANVLAYDMIGNIPNSAVLNPATGLFSCKFTEEDYRQEGYLIEFKVFDGIDSSTNNFRLNLIYTNQAPLIEGANTIVQIQEQQEVNITELLEWSFKDVDNQADSFTFTLKGEEIPEGMQVDNQGNITWMPTEAQGPGFYAVTLSLSDGDSIEPRSVEREFKVEVLEVNEAPEFDESIEYPSDVRVGELFNYFFKASDPDLPVQTLRYSGEDLPEGLVVYSNGQVLWTPGSNQVGTNKFILKVTDEDGAFGTMNVVLNVLPAEGGNLYFLPLEKVKTEEYSYLVLPLIAISSAGVTEVSYSLIEPLDEGMQLDEKTGLFVWTPDEQDGGKTFEVTVRAEEVGNSDNRAELKFYIEVEEVNHPPVITPIKEILRVDEEKTLSVPIEAIDPEGEKLSYSIVSIIGTDNQELTESGAVFSGTNFVWTPSEEHGPGAYTVTVRVRDSETINNQSEMSFRVIVRAVNNPPYFDSQNQTLTVYQGGLFNHIVEAKDDDLPPELVVYKVERAPDSLMIHPYTGQITWLVPLNQEIGEISFEVIASDINAGTGKMNLILNVRPAAEMPVSPSSGMIELAAVVEENELFEFSLYQRTKDQVWKWFVQNAPETAIIDYDAQMLRWIPGETDGGSTSEIYFELFTEDQTQKKEARLTLNVEETNEAPEIVVGEIPSIRLNQEIRFKIDVVDSDIPEQQLSLDIQSPLPSEAVFNSATGEFCWRPTSKEEFTDDIALIFRAEDNGNPVLSTEKEVVLSLLESENDIENAAYKLEKMGEEEILSVEWSQKEKEIYSLYESGSDIEDVWHRVGDISIQDDILVLDYQIPNEGDGWFVLRDHSGIFIPVSIWNRTGEDTVRLCWDLSTLAGEQRLGLNIQETLESQSNWESPLISFDLQKRTFTFSKILESIDGVRNIHVEYKR